MGSNISDLQVNILLYTQMLYVNHIVTTNRKPTVETQKIKRKKAKKNATKSHHKEREQEKKKNILKKQSESN